MNGKEQKRLMVLNKVNSQEIRVKEAATILSLSIRQTWRLLAAYRRESAAALAHGNRGRKPAHTLPESLKEQVFNLGCSTYAGCNTQHFTELLGEREGIRLSRSTVRRVLLESGIRGAEEETTTQASQTEGALFSRGYAGADRWQSP